MGTPHQKHTCCLTTEKHTPSLGYSPQKLEVFNCTKSVKTLVLDVTRCVLAKTWSSRCGHQGCAKRWLKRSSRFSAAPRKVPRLGARRNGGKRRALGRPSPCSWCGKRMKAGQFGHHLFDLYHTISYPCASGKLGLKTLGMHSCMKGVGLLA